MDFLLFLMAVVPSAVLLWLFVSSDKYPEPAGALVSSFLLGVLIVLGIYLLFPFLSLVASGLPADNPYIVGASHAFLMAALPEEALKFIVLRRYCVNHPAFDEPMDGIVYGVTVSLGFATAENLLYVLDGGLHVAVGRAFLAVPCHALVGAVMGYHVGQAAFSRGERSGLYVKALLLSILFHGLYDFAPLTFRAAASMDYAIPEPVSLGLDAFFVVVLFVLVQYVAVLTRSMKARQREQAPPSFGFSRDLPNRVGALDPTVSRSRVGRWIKACRDETAPMDLLFSALCLMGVFCALAGAAHMGTPGDPLSRISLAVAVVFFVYGIGFAARGMGKLTVKMLRERDRR
ncbi:hypothetical protein DND132_1996 [Pseudodesulfovibrio mercurii]|uniref:Protease PrsW n=1 Tax=Pseudodesulfovibrio mercurii TaxID=641491 RepID=F0JH87_9BACT|nr:PrsW family glutamic-type intramembrane protease [Pseudodesulfovibrio mercurii]EGB15202.1 hypothetical protein DND132_1996 [Pseudodesulfovibrio mercurii]